MRLLLDEMHAPVIAEALRCDGHDVEAVAATASLRATSDEDLLAYASAEQYVIVTENVGDFVTITRRWATEDRRHAGLIFTNPRTFNRATIAYPGNLLAALRELLRDPPSLTDSGTWWL